MINDIFIKLPDIKCRDVSLDGRHGLIFLLKKKNLDDGYHECTRPCSVEASWKKTCVYHFFVTESHGATR